MKEKNNRQGIGFLDGLTLIFITLKLCGVIDWSWIWVLAPLWGFMAVIGIIVGVSLILDK